MARHADRHATGPSPLLAGTLALVAVAGLAAAIDHWRHRPPVDPLAVVLELADGRTHRPPPFEGCDGHHCDRLLDELPHDPPPAGMFEPDEPGDAPAPAARAITPATARNAGRPREHTIRRGR